MNAVRVIGLFALITAVFTWGSFAQGGRCSSIQPFCAGNSTLIFPNSHPGNSSQTNAEVGPDYGCLATQPYPAWFYLQIADPGDLEFLITQSSNPDGTGAFYDVDFIVWGPFTDGEEFCSNTALSAQNTIDCSYSPSSVERMTIRNAVADEIYVVLITNFSAAPGYISLQQTNTGGGSTDCSIVGSALGDDQVLCGETSFTLDATNPQADTYTWFVLNEQTNTYVVIPGETGPTLTVTQTGNYQVTVRNIAQNQEASDDVLIEFFDLPVAATPGPVFGCPVDENVIYDLTTAGEELTGNNSGTYSIRFYRNQADYDSGIVIQNPERYAGTEDEIILATIVDQNSGCESSPVQVELNPTSNPEINLDPETVLCVNANAIMIAPVSIGKDLGIGYIYNWSPANDPDGNGIQNPVFTISELPSQGVITLELTNKETGCKFNYSTQLRVFAPPVNIITEISGSDFDNGYTIVATAVRGIGEETRYEYRLDNGPWQENSTFTGVSGGSHRLYAREINGCGDPFSIPLRLIGYRRFFTPNSDGYNDTWNVINDNIPSIKKLYIFDRYGKLLKEINPTSGGWDGTYNGKNMPADDYWFLLQYIDPETGELEEFKANFTLKR